MSTQPDHIPLHQILFQKYYDESHSARMNDDVTSSHWKEFGKKIRVTSVNRNGVQDFDLIGYGFGDNSKANLVNKAFTFTSTFVNVLTLKMPSLAADVSHSKKLLRRMGFSFSQDAFRQVCTLNLLKRQLISLGTPKQILIIGDGQGTLSALLHDTYPEAEIFLVDLGPMLFFQSYYLNKAFPEAAQKQAGNDPQTNATFHFCAADDLNGLLDAHPDIAINIASMQEMDMKIVEGYFSLLRQLKTKAFYCCNRLEKKIPGGEVIRFMEYPWKSSDKHLVDELCPWHKWFIKFLRNNHAAHVKFAGIPIPFVHVYDGPHWHRFTLLSN